MASYVCRPSNVWKHEAKGRVKTEDQKLYAQQSRAIRADLLSGKLVLMVDKPKAEPAPAAEAKGKK